jgi:hypothetical protein
VDVVGPLAEHDHRRVRIQVAGEPVAGADGVEEIERLSVDVRDQVGLVDGQQGDRLGAVRGRSDEVSVGGQVGREERPSGVVLVCEQDRLIALGHVYGTSLEVLLTLLTGRATDAQFHARGGPRWTAVASPVGADSVRPLCAE